MTFESCGILTVEAADVFHSDLAVPPDGADDGIELPALEAPEGDAEILPVDDEAERALVHVEDDEELVGNDEGLVGLEERWVGDARVVFAVVVELVPAEIPAPGGVGAADEALVADGVEGCVGCGDTDDGVRAPLSGRPAHLPGVQALGEADLAAYAVCRLGDGMPVERELVVVLDEYVEGAVLAVPRVLELRLPKGWGHVEKDVQACGPRKVLR